MTADSGISLDLGVKAANLEFSSKLFQKSAAGKLHARKMSILIPTGLGVAAVALLITAIVLVVLKQSMVFSGVFFALSGGLTLADILFILVNRRKNEPSLIVHPKEDSPKSKEKAKIVGIGYFELAACAKSDQEEKVAALKTVSKKVLANWEAYKKLNPSKTNWTKNELIDALGFPWGTGSTLFNRLVKEAQIALPSDGIYSKQLIERFMGEVKTQFGS